MKYLFLVLLTVVGLNGLTQVFYTETFDGTPCAAGSGCDPSLVGWNVTITGAEGGSANLWYVSDREAGLAPPACGASGGGDQSLHVGNVSTSTAAFLFCPGGDCGAAYDDSSPAEITDKRAESPVIDCSLQVGTITADFNYLEAGEALDDNMSFWYRDNVTAWTQIDPIAKSGTGCAPQGQWTAYSVVLPASSSGNPDVQIGFRWTNDGDGAATDPSAAVDDITLTLTVTTTPPVAAFSASDSTLCENDCIDFTDLSTSSATGGITAWSWDFGNGQTSTDQNPVGICYTTAGDYTVSLTVTDADGSDTETLVDLISVVACPGPSASFNADNSNICTDSCVNYTSTSTSSDPGGITGWEWAFPGGSPASHSGEFPPTICYSTAGSYDAELIVTDAAGADTTIVTVTVNDPLSLTVSSDTMIFLGDTATLVAASGFTNYSWSPTDSLDCPLCQITNANPTITTTYMVSADDANGCPTSASVLVTVQDTTTAVTIPDTLYIPNVFTPNGDGINDIFRVTAPVDFKMEVYNRWGQLVFTSSLQNYWDGRTNNGEPCTAGTYYYVIELEDGEVYTGFLSLKR